MNSITRLILRRLVSGNVALTPHVLKVLKEFEQDHPAAGAPMNPASEPAPPPAPAEGEPPDDEEHLTFVNPLPGRWIRRTECGVGIALLLAASLAHAALPTDTLETANHAFAQGKYAEAARGYESIITRQGYSAAALFNLANAQQRDDQPGNAILNYERASLLSPNDPDITANLNSARQKAGLETKRASAIQKATRALTLNTWFILAAAAMWLIAVTPLLKYLLPQARGRWNLGGVLATFALAVAAGALTLRSTDLRRAVVTAREVVAGVSPVTVAQPVFKLRAGEIVTWEGSHGDFVLVRTATGRAGWVKAGEITRVISSPTS